MSTMVSDCLRAFDSNATVKILKPITHAFKPRNEISNNVVYATSKASDQPAHMRSLIRVFASRLNIL